jgi:hypothetical protein
MAKRVAWSETKRPMKEVAFGTIWQSGASGTSTKNNKAPRKPTAMTVPGVEATRVVN